MNTALACLVAFSLWTLLLVLLTVLPFRIIPVIRGTARADAFPGDVPHGTDRYRRMLRAHMNCVENLPVFGAVVLTAAVSGYESAAFSSMAVGYVAARVVQSSLHIASGSAKVISARATFFTVQVTLVCIMGVMVLRHLL